MPVALVGQVALTGRQAGMPVLLTARLRRLSRSPKVAQNVKQAVRVALVDAHSNITSGQPPQTNSLLYNERPIRRLEEEILCVENY